MNGLIIGLLTVMATNRVGQWLEWNRIASLRPITAMVELALPEYQRLEISRERVISRIDQVIVQARQRHGMGEPVDHLLDEVDELIRRMKADYARFLKKYPHHVYGRLSLARFLHEIGESEAAEEELQRVQRLAPREPAVWNLSGVFYVHEGEVKRGLECFEKARALDPSEPLYDRNLASVVSTYRRDALEFYGLEDDIAVLTKAIELYSEAVRKGGSFRFQKELAETYYFLPKDSTDPRVQRMEREAIEQWHRAVELARNEDEAGEAWLHLARWYLRVGEPEQASVALDRVNAERLQPIKRVLARRIKELLRENTSQPVGSRP